MSAIDPKVGEIYSPIGDKPSLDGRHYSGNFYRIHDVFTDKIFGKWFVSFEDAREKKNTTTNTDWYIEKENWHKIKLISTSPTSPNFIMSVVQKFRDSLMSKDSKALRKAGLKDECGHWTDEAQKIWLELQMNSPENTVSLVTAAESLNETEEEKKCCK